MCSSHTYNKRWALGHPDNHHHSHLLNCLTTLMGGCSVVQCHPYHRRCLSSLMYPHSGNMVLRESPHWHNPYSQHPQDKKYTHSNTIHPSNSHYHSHHKQSHQQHIQKCRCHHHLLSSIILPHVRPLLVWHVVLLSLCVCEWVLFCVSGQVGSCLLCLVIIIIY